MWEEFTPLAREKGAVNLGQGFPDWPTPAFVKAAAVRALEDNFNQVRSRERMRPDFNHVRGWERTRFTEVDVRVRQGCPLRTAGPHPRLMMTGIQQRRFLQLFYSSRLIVDVVPAACRSWCG